MPPTDNQTPTLTPDQSPESTVLPPGPAIPAQSVYPTPEPTTPPPPAPTPIFGVAAAPGYVGAPMPPVPGQTMAEPTVNNPGVIVLQWLTYAFWGWTILGMSILTTMVLASFINQAETGSFMPYGIAAVLVLLPISIVCDVFYGKKEPEKKTGAASIVMVIHAVIFALFGIGALITIVFSIISMVTSSTGNDDNQVMLLSSLIIAVLYGAVFLRTINPARLPFVRRFFVMFMVVVVGIVSILGIVGPMANERATRNDRLIESDIGSLKAAIDRHAVSNKKLPATLDELKLSGNTKLLIEKDLVKYTANISPSSIQSSSSLRNKITAATYYYELCVHYKKAKEDRYSSGYDRSDSDSDGCTTYISPYYHDAGEECYKVKTNSYDY